MTEEQIHKIFEHAMNKDGYMSAEYFIMSGSQYAFDDIREMFRGFKLGWNAARYLADVELGIASADAGQLTPIEDVKAKWQEFQPWMR